MPQSELGTIVVSRRLLGEINHLTKSEGNGLSGDTYFFLSFLKQRVMYTAAKVIIPH